MEDTNQENYTNPVNEVIMMSEKDSRLWAMLCHVSTFLGHFIPFANLIAPLVIWQMKKDQSEFVDFHGKEALNFQISVLIYLIVSGILVLAVIGIALLALVGLFNLIVVIMAAIKANNGERYNYPLCIRFIK